MFQKSRFKSKDGRHEIRIQQKTGTDGPYAEVSLWQKTRYSWKPTGRVKTVSLQEPHELFQETQQLTRAARTMKYNEKGSQKIISEATRLEKQIPSIRESLNARLIEAIKSLVEDFDPDGGEISV